MKLLVENLTLALAQKEVARDVAFTLQAGEIVAIIGPNGAGKSSVMKSLAGLIEPVSGAIYVGETRLDTLTPEERARRIAYLPQGFPLHWPLQVEALARMGRGLGVGPLSADDQSMVDEALRRTGLSEMREVMVNHLSGGEQARAHLARLFASDAKIWLLDEPVAALDPYYQMSILKSLLAAKAAGKIVVIILHNIDHVLTVADRVLALDGIQKKFGTTQEVLTPAFLSDLYKLKVSEDLRFSL